MYIPYPFFRTCAVLCGASYLSSSTCLLYSYSNVASLNLHTTCLSKAPPFLTQSRLHNTFLQTLTRRALSRYASDKTSWNHAANLSSPWSSPPTSAVRKCLFPSTTRQVFVTEVSELEAAQSDHRCHLFSVPVFCSVQIRLGEVAVC